MTSWAVFFAGLYPFWTCLNTLLAMLLYLPHIRFVERWWHTTASWIIAHHGGMVLDMATISTASKSYVSSVCLIRLHCNIILHPQPMPSWKNDHLVSGQCVNKCHDRAWSTMTKGLSPVYYEPPFKPNGVLWTGSCTNLAMFSSYDFGVCLK